MRQRSKSLEWVIENAVVLAGYELLLLLLLLLPQLRRSTMPARASSPRAQIGRAHV